MSSVLTETVNYLFESETLTVPSNNGFIKISQREKPIIVATNKWEVKNNKLYKQYDFNRISNRNLFIMELLKYESENGHNAKILITENAVAVMLYTKNVNSITELDKEYQKFSDSLYKDICYG